MLRASSPFAIKVRDIPAEGLVHALDELDEWAVRTIAEVEPGARARGLRADLTLHADGDDVTVTGTLRGEVVLRCGRCLGDALVAVAVELGLQYVPAGERAGDDAEVEEYREGVVDLEEALREELLLALPMVPRCGEACKGLCPQCGQDFNQGACGCPTRSVDDRWAALARVKL